MVGIKHMREKDEGINVGKTIKEKTSPSHHHLYRWYVYHSQMGGLWHCFKF